jgi:hypothetical protein
VRQGIRGGRGAVGAQHRVANQRAADDDAIAALIEYAQGQQAPRRDARRDGNQDIAFVGGQRWRWLVCSG